MKCLPIVTLPIAILLGACASSPDEARFKGEDTANVESAVSSPAYDLGFEDIDIPPYLAEMTNPYADPPAGCADAISEVEFLNDLLGEDLDVPEDVAQRREQTALNATSDTIGSVLIPFRGVVRAITGAARNARDARQAYQRGLVRRAYIKGMIEQLNCTES